jgi:hypothetical protein
MEDKMNERIEKLAEQCYVRTGSSHTDHFEYWKFAEMIAEECARMCMSQADRKNIRSAFGLPVESSVKYKGPEPSNSIESQYDRTLNTTKIE